MQFSFALGSWLQIPSGSNSAHHIALIQLERSAELPFKIPSLRNIFDKFGFDLSHTNSRAGFGLFHDGSVDSPVRIVQDGFGITSDQVTADIMAFLLSFSGSDLIPGNIFDVNRAPGVASLDTPAAVGRQITVSNSTPVPLLTTMIALANSSTSRVDLVAKGFKDGLPRGWFFDRTTGNFQSDRLAEVFSPTGLQALAGPGGEQTYTVVPRGTGRRIGIDRDADGYLDRDELDFGSDPANPLSLATNTPPHLATIPDLVVLKGRALSIVLSATDSDIPAQQLTFSLGTNAPPGASLDPTNGIFTWTASGPPGAITNSITITVTDNGKPNRSDSKTFNVISVDLTLSQLSINTNGVTLNWSGMAGLTYRLQYKNKLSDPVWVNIPGDVLATNLTASKLDTSLSTNAARFYRIIALP